MSKDYITQKDISKKDMENAQKECDEIKKKYGLDKIDKKFIERLAKK